MSINTIPLAFGLECNVTGDSARQIAFIKGALSTSKAAILSGHVPPSMWRESCRAQYAFLSLTFASVIKQHMYGHLHSDQFFLMDGAGQPLNACDTAGAPAAAIACAPSVVPTFNPSVRVWTYDRSTLDILDYTQYYEDIDRINFDGKVSMKVEYQLSTAYNFTRTNGRVVDLAAWCSLALNLQANITAALQYELYKAVSVVPSARDLVCKGEQSWRC